MHDLPFGKSGLHCGGTYRIRRFLYLKRLIATEKIHRREALL